YLLQIFCNVHMQVCNSHGDVLVDKRTEIRNPKGIAVDAEDNIYVADGDTGNIVKFTSTLELITNSLLKKERREIRTICIDDVTNRIAVCGRLGIEIYQLGEGNGCSTYL